MALGLCTPVPTHVLQEVSPRHLPACKHTSPSLSLSLPAHGSEPHGQSTRNSRSLQSHKEAKILPRVLNSPDA